jgi:predicted permease
MPSGFRFPATQKVWLPLILEGPSPYQPTLPSLMASGRLQHGVTLEQARAEFANIAAALAAEHPENRDTTASIRPYQHAFVTVYTRTVIWAMSAAVLFVLLIACSNLANLMLARTIARQKDIAVRAALGANRWRILAHVLTESLVLAFCGGVLGYFLADLGLHLTQRAFIAADIEEPFWVVFNIDWRALLAAALAAVAAGIIAGLPPALRATRTDVNEYLKAGSKGSGARTSRLSRTLVTAEIALSCILLVCSGLMIQTVANIDARPLAIDNTNLLIGRLNLPQSRYPDEAAWYRFYEQLVLSLQAHPEVISATAAYSYPGINTWILPYRTRGMEVPEGDPLPLAQFAGVMDNYAEALGLQLLRGRWFDSRDGIDSQRVAIIDARFAAKVFAGENPIGQQVSLGHPTYPDSEWRTVVGVTEAVFMDGIDNPERPAAMVPLRQMPYPLLSVAVHTRGDPLAFADTLRATVHEMDPDVPVFWVRTFDNWIWQNNFDSRSVSILFSIFAVIAVLLAAAGIYAVLAYAVGQRTREIGMRRAMGAPDGRILNTVLGQAMRQLGVGLGVGLLCAVGFARLLSGYLYGVSPIDAPTLLGVASILCVVALLASFLPARRALRINPMEALRDE